MSFNWNPRNLTHLADMWSKGLTAAQIAAAIGCQSRSAVIAKARRLGLNGRPSPIKRRDPNAPRPERKPPKPREPAVDMGEVRRLLIEGTTCAQIAETLGISESWAYRMRQRLIKAEPLLPLSSCNPNTRGRSRVSLAGLDSEPESKRIPFHKLERKECQWFTGPITRFHAHEAECCAHDVVAGRAWCPHHNERAADRRKTEESRAA